MCGSKNLEELSDKELLDRLQQNASDEHMALMETISLIIELEKRGTLTKKGYGSTFAFLTKELKLEESQAFRRIRAGRCCRRFPQVWPLMVNKSLRLSAVSEIYKVINEENCEEIIKECVDQPFRTVQQIVARKLPREEVKDTITPVGSNNNTKQNGKNNELPSLFDISPGNIEKENQNPNLNSQESSQNSSPTNNPQENSPNTSSTNNSQVNSPNSSSTNSYQENYPNSSSTNSYQENYPNSSSTNSCHKDNQEAKNGESEDNTSPSDKNKSKDQDESRVKITFGANRALANKLEKVKTLLSGKYPQGANLEQILNLVLDDYIERKDPDKKIVRKENRQKKKALKTTAMKESQTSKQSAPKPRSRYIPQAVKDEVWKRDGGKCTYVGEDGRRCGQTWGVQYDHLEPFCLGGKHEAGNIALRCRHHNIAQGYKILGAKIMGPHLHNTANNKSVNPKSEQMVMR